MEFAIFTPEEYKDLIAGRAIAGYDLEWLDLMYLAAERIIEHIADAEGCPIFLRPELRIQVDPKPWAGFEDRGRSGLPGVKQMLSQTAYIVVTKGLFDLALEVDREQQESGELAYFEGRAGQPITPAILFFQLVVAHEFIHYGRNHLGILQEIPGAYHALEYDADTLAAKNLMTYCLMKLRWRTYGCSEGDDPIAWSRRLVFLVMYGHIRKRIGSSLVLLGSKTHPEWTVRLVYCLISLCWIACRSGEQAGTNAVPLIDLILRGEINEARRNELPDSLLDGRSVPSTFLHFVELLKRPTESMPVMMEHRGMFLAFMKHQLFIPELGAFGKR